MAWRPKRKLSQSDGEVALSKFSVSKHQRCDQNTPVVSQDFQETGTTVSSKRKISTATTDETNTVKRKHVRAFNQDYAVEESGSNSKQPRRGQSAAEATKTSQDQSISSMNETSGCVSNRHSISTTNTTAERKHHRTCSGDYGDDSGGKAKQPRVRRGQAAVPASNKIQDSDTTIRTRETSRDPLINESKTVKRKRRQNRSKTFSSHSEQPGSGQTVVVEGGDGKTDTTATTSQITTVVKVRQPDIDAPANVTDSPATASKTESPTNQATFYHLVQSYLGKRKRSEKDVLLRDYEDNEPQSSGYVVRAYRIHLPAGYSELVQCMRGVHVSQKPTLLTLPGEVRNLIHRYVLLNRRPILISSRNHEQPGLLRTCRQIRDEATKIYNEENEFVLVMRDFKLERQNDHWSLNVTQIVMHRGHPSWQNLLEWLKCWWQYLNGGKEVMRSIPTASAHLDRRHLPCEHAFDIVEMLAKDDWDTIEKVLEKYKQAVEGQRVFRFGP